MKNTQTETAEKTLNTELMNVSEWLTVNMLSLNVNKTKYIFHTNRKCVNYFQLRHELENNYCYICSKVRICVSDRGLQCVSQSGVKSV